MKQGWLQALGKVVQGFTEPDVKTGLGVHVPWFLLHHSDFEDIQHPMTASNLEDSLTYSMGRLPEETKSRGGQ